MWNNKERKKPKRGSFVLATSWYFFKNLSTAENLLVMPPTMYAKQDTQPPIPDTGTPAHCYWHHTDQLCSV